MFYCCCRRTSEVGEVGGDGAELIPHISGGVAGQFHRPHFVEEDTMEPSSSTIMHGSVRDSEKVEDALS